MSKPESDSDTAAYTHSMKSSSDQASTPPTDLEQKPVDNPTPEPALPPEEGLKGWLCVLGAFFTVFASFGFLNAVGVFQSFYQDTYLHGYSPSAISWIFSFQLMCMWCPGPLYGRLVDTYGPGPVLYPCGILCVFALCMTSLSKEFYQIFLSQGVAFGLGAGGVFTSSFICVGQWFVQRRGLAIGVASLGSSAGGVVFPLFLYKLLQEVKFEKAVQYTALLIGVSLIAGFCLVRSRLPKKKWDRKAKWFEVALFKEAKFACFTFGGFLVMWGLWEPFDFITLFAEQNSFKTELALSLICMINATSIAGRLLPTWLSDKVGHFNVITVSGFLTGLSILCLWLPFDFHPSHAGIIVFALVYGAVSGAFVSLLMPCVAKTGSLETLGMRFGTFQVVIGLANLTGLPISGAILAKQTHQGNMTFWGLQTFALVSALLGSMLCLASTILIGRSKGTKKV